MDGTGTLYGTTLLGGRKPQGNIFALSASESGWSLTSLAMLYYKKAQGYYPLSGVLLAPGNELYGTASAGGNSWEHVRNMGYGTVFSLPR